MSKWDLQWSVTDPSTFVTLSSDKLEINLHHLTGKVDTSKRRDDWQYKQASKAELYLRSRADLQGVKCFAVCPNPNSENALALGLTTGKVVLTAFNVDPSLDKTGLVGCEIHPKHPKVCTALTWNPTEHRLIAVSYEKHKPDQCLAVYDVNSVSHKVNRAAMTSGVDRSRPSAEFGTQSDVVNSVTWLPQPPTCLVAGFAGKYLKKFDIRDPVSPKSVATTRGVYGLAADPLFEHHLASYFEDQIYIWDLRNFDKPVISVKEVRPVSKLEWNPNRKGLLMSLPKESSAVKMYQLEHVSNEVEYTERLIHPLQNQTVSNFAMHPTKENNMVVVSPTGFLQEFTVHDSISVSLSPHSALSMASSRNLMHCERLEESTPEIEKDISLIMKKRALAGYGIQSRPSANVSFLRKEDVMLRKMWEWMDYMQTLKKEKKIPFGKRGYELYGIKAVLKGELQMQDDDKAVLNQVQIVQWDGVEIESKVYRSKERSLALILCGWTVDVDDGSLMELLKRIESSGDYERAACIAVFCLQIRQAIDILKRGAARQQDRSASLTAVAMALAGLTQNKLSLWCEMCSSLSRQLHSPYMRAMFSFLTTSDSTKFESVLKEGELQIEDRLGFACLYLNDQHLNEYVEQVSTSIIRNGQLEGVLVTGLIRPSGMELLQCYVDQTCDVQSVSCVMLHASDLARDKRSKQWMESYKRLLDTWRLWHQRAKFDMFLHASDSRIKVPDQTFVNCHFCSSPISPHILSSRSSGRTPMRMGGSGHSIFKPQSCYVCRKALPRCSLCQMNMGSLSGASMLLPQGRGRRPDNSSGGGDNMDHCEVNTKFDLWFSWCQSCRHGGHGCHLREWFSHHSECPVTGCTCKCMLLDTVGAVPAMDSMET